jgi:transposase-like protein
MNQPISKTKPRRKYDREFKRQTVEHWLNSGKTAVEIGRELGINPTRLYAWRDRSLGAKGKVSGSQRSSEQLEAENAQLRRANEELRQQRDILKKTLGILSEPPNSATNGSTP